MTRRPASRAREKQKLRLFFQQAKQLAGQAEKMREEARCLNVEHCLNPDDPVNLAQLKTELKKLRRLAQSLETKTRNF